MSATFEDGSDHTIGDARMVWSYERYSAFGGKLAVSAVTAGGSEAMFFKINTVGEDTFLDKAVQALESFAAPPARTGDPYADGELLGPRRYGQRGVLRSPAHALVPGEVRERIVTLPHHRAPCRGRTPSFRPRA